jgi:PAS domain S-box-containing protein
MNPIDQKAAEARDIAGLLARSSFAGQLAGGAPLLVAAGQPARILFASQAAHAIFRSSSLEELGAAVLGGASPGARRLRQLASAPSAGAPPKLELLRFFVGRLPLQLALLCAPLANGQGEVFLVAAPPGPEQSAGNAKQAAQQNQAIEAPTGEPSMPQSSVSSGDQDGVAARRFLWSANERLDLDAPAAALAEAVGEAAPRLAEPLETLKARTGLDEKGDFAKALARQATFRSLRLAWPRDSERDAIIVALSGAPIFDRDRRFLGYRGFGVVTSETAPFEAKRSLGEAGQDRQDAPPVEPAETTAQPTHGGEERAAPESGIVALETSAPISPPIDAPPGATLSEAQYSEPESQPAAERGADVVSLRPSTQAYVGGPNVVPIRPGALRAFLSLDEGARRDEDGEESVELTTHERDAFREIARALGAKVRDNSDRRGEPPLSDSEPASPTQNPARDFIDLGIDDPPHSAAAVARDDGAPSVPESADLSARNASHLLDRLPIGALVTSDGKALYLNRTLLDLLGYRDLAQFRATSGLSRIFEGHPSEPVSLSGEDGALTLNADNGEAIVVNAQIQAIEWDGAPATLISLRRSLEAEFAPQRRALELDARAREAEVRELSAVLDTATDGVVMLDGQARILSLNRPGEALFGFDQKEVAGESFLTLLSPESHEPVQAYFDGLRTSGLASLLNDGREALGRERHGRAIPLFITLGRINSSPDAKFCAVLRDMTQWKTIEGDLEEARGQAEKASALKSEFLAKISHEIRTPLNAILGFAEVIMDERFGPIGNDRYKEYLKDIHSSGAHVMSLINDLLDLSKIEAGKLELSFVPVDANRIIQECVSLMQPQAAHERIIMRLSLFDKLPRIVADERSLRQIMLNLMSNAVNFNEPGGQVIVSTAMNETGQAVIRVRDTGIGMSETELGVALEPFQRISTSRPTGGTGLGLPLTKALVEANRAGFSIKSRKEQGTLVEIAFPTAQAAAQ